MAVTRLPAPLHWLPSLSEKARLRIGACLRFVAGVGIGAVVGLAAFFAPLLMTPAEQLLPNTRIDGNEVGGCQAEAVRSFLRDSGTPPKLWVSTPERMWTLSLESAGGALLIDEAVDRALGLRASGSSLTRAWQSWNVILHGRDLSIRTCWNRDELRQRIREIAWVTNRAPANAKLVRRENGFAIVPS